MIDRQRWQSLVDALDLSDETDTFDQLLRTYSERHRHYHTLAHIQYCLDLFDQLSPGVKRSAEIELALWFHDAIYSPRSKNNEAKSAEWAQKFVLQAGGDAAASQRIADMIMATRHNAIPSDENTKLLVDIDLSILGSSSDTYDQFEANVRKEYKWVPKLLYRRERRKILQSFLDRKTIFATPVIRGAREKQARQNLKRAIASL